MDSTSSSSGGNGFRSRWHEEDSSSTGSRTSSAQSQGHAPASFPRPHSETDDLSLLNHAHAATRQADDYALDEKALGKLNATQRTVVLSRYLQKLKSSPDAQSSSEQVTETEAALIDALNNVFKEMGQVRGDDCTKASELFADFVLKQEAHEQALATQWKKARSGYTKEAWDIAAGACAYGFCFGGGTLISRLGGPFIGPVAAAWAGWGTNVIAWILIERLLPLIRMTSWSSKAADVDYALLIRLSGRMAHDALTANAGSPPKKFHVTNEHGKEEHLTAAQYRARLSWWQAWKHKVVTDDLPYHCYSVAYFIRHLTFDTVTASQFRKSLPGILTNAATHFVVGMLAGASTMALMQAARRRACMSAMGDKYQQAEILTITPQIHARKAEMLRARLKLMELIAASIDSNAAQIQALDEQSKINEQLQEASNRDTWRKLIWTEFCIPFSRSRKEHIESFGLRGEVSGKLYSTIISALAKGTCLLQSLLVTSYLLNINPDRDDVATLAWKHGLSQLLLIFWFGFAARKEWELLYSVLASLLSGIKDNAVYCLGLAPPQAAALETVVIVANVLSREKSMRSLVSLSQLPSLPGNPGKPGAEKRRKASEGSGSGSGSGSEEDSADDALSRLPSPGPFPLPGKGYAPGGANGSTNGITNGITSARTSASRTASRQPPRNGHGGGHGNGGRNGSIRQPRIDGSSGADTDTGTDTDKDSDSD